MALDLFHVVTGIALIYTLLCVGVAAWLPRQRPRTGVTWALASFLVLEACASGIFAWLAAEPLAPDHLRAAFDTIFLFGALVQPFVYLVLVGLVVRSPIGALFARTSMLIVLAAALTLQLLYWFRPDPPQPQPAGLWMTFFFGPILASGAVGLAAAIQWFCRASSLPERRRAAGFLAAFAVRDLFLLLGYGIYAWVSAVHPELASTRGFNAWWGVALYGQGFLFLAFLLYGALTGRILDLDRRFSLRFSQASALGALGFAFLVATETLEAAVGSSNAVASVLVAIGLAALFLPIHRLMRRIVCHFVPAGKPLAELARQERLAMYHQQVELAWSDERTSDAEEQMLERFRARLGIEPDQAARVHRDVRRSMDGRSLVAGAT